jgi:hypothetical protein
MDRIWELMDRRAAAIERAKTGPQVAAVARARQRKKTLARCIKNSMKNFHITFTEAAILLDIPESDWDMYRKILEEKRYSDI